LKQTKITDQITYVEPDTMANLAACSGIIVQSKKKIFIDMNLGPEDAPMLIEKEKPDAAIITHFHLDHSIWTRYIDVGSDAVVFIPEKEVPYLTSLDFVIEHTAGPFDVAGKWKDFMVNTLKYQPLSSYQTYNEHTTLKEFAPEIVLVQTPGHSPSHTSLYFPDDKILFSGDMGLENFGPWYGWKDCSIEQMVESIFRLDGMDVELILTSHGGLLKNKIQEKWARAIHHILKREEQIMTKLDAGMDKQDVIQQGVFYCHKEKAPNVMRPFLDMWDTVMYYHHEHLIKSGGLMTLFPEITGMLNRKIV